MTMRLINARSVEVMALIHGKRKQDTVSVAKSYLYFSKSFALTYGMKAGQHLHFINDGPGWKFFFNSDPDGFLLVKDKRGSGALRVFHTGIIHLINRTTGHLGSCIYPIEATVLEQKGCKVFMILTNKPIKPNAK